MSRIQFLALLMGGLLLAACSNSPKPTREIQFGNRRLGYDFVNAETNWDTYITEGQRALFRVDDGMLEGAVVGNAGYIWSLDHERHSDLAVRAKVRQSRGDVGNGFFGLMCRADELGNGYYFLISSDRRFSINKGTLQQPDLEQLVAWQGSAAIQPGDAFNDMTIVCSGDYLAMFVNGVFLAEAQDADHTAGYLGVALAALDEATWAEFDDIVIQEVVVIGG